MTMLKSKVCKSAITTYGVKTNTAKKTSIGCKEARIGIKDSCGKP